MAPLIKLHFVCNIYMTVCLQTRITVGSLMLAICSKHRGFGRNFYWLVQSCDISACDLNPERNPEKHGRPLKLAITPCIKIDKKLVNCIF